MKVEELGFAKKAMVQEIEHVNFNKATSSINTNDCH
jgi:hypothetical protein